MPTEEQAPPMGWHARPARLQDEAGVLALYRDSFGRERSGADWRWKMMARPGLAPLTWVAESDAGELVGHHGAIPFRFSMGGEVLDVVQSVEAMTAPSWRGRGLLKALGKPVYDGWAEAGVGFILGMPNEKWGRRAAEFGFLQFTQLEWLKLVLRPSRAFAPRLPGPVALALRPADPLVSRMPTLLSSGGVKVREIARAGAEINAIWRRAAPSYQDAFLLVRDSGYVQWRYLDCPQAYRVLVAEDAAGPAGYAAFRVTEVEGRQIGWLADAFAPGDEGKVWGALLRAAALAMSRDGADSVAALANPDAALYRELRRRGFVKSGHEFAVSMVPGAWEGCAAALAQPQRWQLAGGNFDVI